MTPTTRRVTTPKPTIASLNRDAWTLRVKLADVREAQRALLHERVCGILTPKVVQEARFLHIAKPIADVLAFKTKPADEPALQQLHARYLGALIADLERLGHVWDPAHTRGLNLLRDMLSVSDWQPVPPIAPPPPPAVKAPA